MNLSHRSAAARASRVRPTRPHRRMRPCVETLEPRRLLSSGTFIEDFSDDAHPANPGFDSSGTFAHGTIDTIANPVDMAHQSAAVAACPSPPHALFLIGRDAITFPGLAAGETVTSASVGVHPLGGAAQIVFQGTTDRLTFNLPAQTFNDPWRSRSATSSDVGDAGQSLGPITSITLVGFEIYFDDVRIDVTGGDGSPPQTSVPDAVVGRYFQQLFGRDPEPAATTFWAGKLRDGLPLEQFVAALIASPEYRTLQVQTLYRSLLRRDADEQALQNAVHFLLAGGAVETLTGYLAASDEFFQEQGGGGDAGFLAAAYRDLLGRDIDPAGAAFWAKVLQQNSDTYFVARALLTSDEAVDFSVHALYKRILGRDADSAGAQFFDGQLARGTLKDAVLADLLVSEEFTARYFSAGCILVLLTPNGHYVDRLYHDLLGRSPTCEEADNVLSRLANAQPFLVVSTTITRTSEYRRHVADALFNQYLRQDVSALSYNDLQPLVVLWTDLQDFLFPIYATPQFPIDTTRMNVLANIVGKATTYYGNQGGGTDGGWLDALFTDALNRAPTQSERDMLPLISSGQPNAELGRLQYGRVTVFETQEYETNLLESFYQRFLHRGSDAAGLAFWLGRLQDPVHPAATEEVVAGFTGSQEYFDLAQA